MQVWFSLFIIASFTVTSYNSLVYNQANKCNVFRWREKFTKVKTYKDMIMRIIYLVTQVWFSLFITASLKVKAASKRSE